LGKGIQGVGVGFRQQEFLDEVFLVDLWKITRIYVGLCWFMGVPGFLFWESPFLEAILVPGAVLPSSLDWVWIKIQDQPAKVGHAWTCY
jgi:hypothetical protein